jgi:hypothetical protein
MVRGGGRFDGEGRSREQRRVFGGKHRSSSESNQDAEILAARIDEFAVRLDSATDEGRRVAARNVLMVFGGIAELVSWARAPDFGLSDAIMYVGGSEANDTATLRLLRAIESDTRAMRSSHYTTGMRHLENVFSRQGDLREKDVEAAWNAFHDALSVAEPGTLEESWALVRLAQCEALRGDAELALDYLKRADSAAGEVASVALRRDSRTQWAPAVASKALEWRADQVRDRAATLIAGANAIRLGFSVVAGNEAPDVIKLPNPLELRRDHRKQAIKALGRPMRHLRGLRSKSPPPG